MEKSRLRFVCNFIINNLNNYINYYFFVNGEKYNFCLILCWTILFQYIYISYICRSDFIITWFKIIIMSLSKQRKITPVLPPDQWRKLKCRLSDKQLFWNCRGCKYICGFFSFLFFFYKKDFFKNIFKKN